MATDLTHTPNPRTLDLTGLPEPVIQAVTWLVQEARERQARDAGTANGMAGESFPMFVSDPNPSPEETRRLLDEMAAMGTGQALPPDWSRADIYDDHD